MKIIDKNNTHIEDTVEIGEGTIIYPNVIIEGKTKIGKNCTILMNTYIKDSIIGEENTINSSQITESVLGNKNQIGPNSYIRNNNEIGDNNKIGFCVEIKNSFIGNNNKIKHLSYIGDTILKSNVEIGAGTITANYDGIQKNKQ